MRLIVTGTLWAGCVPSRGSDRMDQGARLLAAASFRHTNFCKNSQGSLKAIPQYLVRLHDEYPSFVRCTWPAAVGGTATDQELTPGNRGTDTVVVALNATAAIPRFGVQPGALAVAAIEKRCATPPRR